jgi:hypothetical protein
LAEVDLVCRARLDGIGQDKGRVAVGIHGGVEISGPLYPGGFKILSRPVHVPALATDLVHRLIWRRDLRDVVKPAVVFPCGQDFAAVAGDLV